MSCINISLIQGRVGQDPKIFEGEGKSKKATFSVARHGRSADTPNIHNN